jgi:hypothetical protein
MFDFILKKQNYELFSKWITEMSTAAENLPLPRRCGIKSKAAAPLYYIKYMLPQCFCILTY